MTDEEFGTRFAYSLGMMTALSQEMLDRRFIIEDFERRGVSLVKFIELAKLTQDISVGYYSDRKENK